MMNAPQPESNAAPGGRKFGVKSFLGREVSPADGRTSATSNGWEQGFDEAENSFIERVDFSGSALGSAPRRTMVQARQIYVFSHASLLNWWPGLKQDCASRRRAICSHRILRPTANRDGSSR